LRWLEYEFDEYDVNLGTFRKLCQTYKTTACIRRSQGVGWCRITVRRLRSLQHDAMPRWRHRRDSGAGDSRKRQSIKI